MEAKEIEQFWQSTDSKDHTSRDPYLGALEQEYIMGRLEGRPNILEIGCGDGIHTVHYAGKATRYTAVDISEFLIHEARIYADKVWGHNIEFLVGNVLDLTELVGNRSYDVVISQRCLINLPTWELQKKALDQIRSCLRNKGLFLLSEGFSEPLVELNNERIQNQLDPIEIVPFNKFLEKETFEKAMSTNFKTLETRDYGLYLYLSRLIHPLIVHPREPEHGSSINKHFHTVHSIHKKPIEDNFTKYSYNQFYAFQKVEGK